MISFSSFVERTLNEAVITKDPRHLKKYITDFIGKDVVYTLGKKYKDLPVGTQFKVKSLNPVKAGETPTVQAILGDKTVTIPVTYINKQKTATISNKGDSAEGILSSVLFLTALNNRKMTKDEVGRFLTSLRKYVKTTNNKLSEVVIKDGVVDQNFARINDVVTLTIKLASLNMDDIIDRWQEFDSEILGACSLAETAIVKSGLGKDLSTNKKVDYIDIVADGISGQKTTKVDVGMKVNDSVIDYKVSLKTRTKQIGQKGGWSLAAISGFFEEFAGINASVFNKFAEQFATDVKKAQERCYRLATEKLNEMFSKKDGELSFLDDFLAGIKKAAAGNDENVKLIDLTNGEFVSLDFSRLEKSFKKVLFEDKIEFKAEFVTKKDVPPKIIISGGNEVFVIFRLKREAKYTRNYVEKGPGLSNLIKETEDDFKQTFSLKEK